MKTIQSLLLYITDVLVKEKNLSVNANREQGFWAFESIAGVQSDQAPAGSTTVPNPLMSTSSIPAGSSVVTGQFAQALEIDGEETEDISIEMSLSANNSFEWQDSNENSRWDVNNSAPEPVVDMDLCGLIPIAYNPN